MRLDIAPKSAGLLRIVVDFAGFVIFAGFGYGGRVIFFFLMALIICVYFGVFFFYLSRELRHSFRLVYV